MTTTFLRMAMFWLGLEAGIRTILWSFRISLRPHMGAVRLMLWGSIAMQLSMSAFGGYGLWSWPPQPEIVQTWPIIGIEAGAIVGVTMFVTAAFTYHAWHEVWQIAAALAIRCLLIAVCAKLWIGYGG